MQFGTFIYNGGILKAEGVLTVNGITIELEGTLDDIEELIIGPNGNVILRFVFLSCLEVLWPSQPNGVMSSAVSLSNHTFTGQA